ncbi:MAG TPA: DUF3410 domain-containing protein, partial [bacterium]|nr:DUF3410 domain-containing protein [bacterium]
GRRVVRKAKSLGMNVLQNDPPRQRVEGGTEFVSFKDALQSDIVTFHVPLTLDGEDTTLHLIDDSLLQLIKPGAIVLNTSRGEVACNSALIKGTDSGLLSAVILDVWEGEPDVDLSVLSKVTLGTPHIAAYTQQGKVNATQMVYESACRFLGQEPRSDVLERIKISTDTALQIPDSTTDLESAISFAFRQIYPIGQDDSQLRKIASMDPDKRKHYFDDLRNNYTLRLEASAYRVQLADSQTAWASAFAELGFSVE